MKNIVELLKELFIEIIGAVRVRSVSDAARGHSAAAAPPT